jgi:hypothetical protein
MPGVNFDTGAFIVFHSPLPVMLTVAITGPAILPLWISSTLASSAMTFSRTDLSDFFPKSTLLYCTQAPFSVKPVFQPLNLSAVSRKEMEAPRSLIAEYLSTCISLVALVTPIPLKVGTTFFIVPSSLKARLSALMDLALSNWGE